MSPIVKLCHCGRLNCHGHTPRRYDTRTTTQRGYGAPHQQRKRELLPAAIGTPCPLCGHTMRADQKLALDHTIPISRDPSSVGDRITHARCNTSRGNRT